jgi:CBS domain-containing protein
MEGLPLPFAGYKPLSKIARGRDSEVLSQLSEVLAVKEHQTVHTVSPSDTVATAVCIMSEFKIGALPVVDNSKLVGIFSERDVLVRIVNEGLDPKTTPVSRVMTENPEHVAPSTTIEDAMRLMRTKGFRHLPVLDHERLVGLISIRDVNEWLTRDEEAAVSRYG